MKNLYLIIIIFACVWLLIPFGLYSFFFINEYGYSISAIHSNWASFGSFIGGVITPVFTFLTLLVLLYTFKSQHEAYKKQWSLIEHQMTDNSFYSMMNHLTDIINGYNYNAQSGQSILNNALINLWRKIGEDKKNDEIDKYFKEYNIHIDFKNFVLHISNIVKFIMTAEISKEKKNFYYEVLNGRLSNRERYFIELCNLSSEYFIDVKKYLNKVNRSDPQILPTGNEIARTGW